MGEVTLELEVRECIDCVAYDVSVSRLDDSCVSCVVFVFVCLRRASFAAAGPTRPVPILLAASFNPSRVSYFVFRAPSVLFFDLRVRVLSLLSMILRHAKPAVVREGGSTLVVHITTTCSSY